MVAKKKIARAEILKKIETEVKKMRDTNKFFDAGKKACEHFFDSLLYRNTDIILLFYPFGYEIPILPVLNRAWQDGKQVALPRIRNEEGEFDFYLLNAHDPLDEQFEQHAYGMFEPRADLLAFDPIDEADDESKEQTENIVALIPGLAFTLQGERLGRGRGFYDRFLERVDKIAITLVGTCFSFQLESDFPIEPHDKNVSYLLTELGLLEL